MRLCSKCKRLLLPENFHKHNGSKSRSDNLDSWCKDCRALSRKVPDSVKAHNKRAYDESHLANVLTEVEASYLAGLLDGEGGIQLRKVHTYDKYRTTTYCLCISITNTFKDVLLWTQMKVGFGSIYAKNRNLLGRNKICWEWRATGRRAIDFLRQIYPYLKIKRLQADIAFEFGETLFYPSRRIGGLPDNIIQIREGLRERIKALNVG